MLATCSFLIIPTWLLFHFSPRHPCHTLPEGFFIQVFMGILMLIVDYLTFPLGDWISIAIPIYYYIAYQQLFGYSIWGTIWRLSLCWLFFISIITSLIIIIEMAINLVGHRTVPKRIGLIICYIILAILLLIGFSISKRGAKKREKRHLQEERCV